MKGWWALAVVVAMVGCGSKEEVDPFAENYISPKAKNGKVDSRFLVSIISSGWTGMTGTTATMTTQFTVINMSWDTLRNPRIRLVAQAPGTTQKFTQEYTISDFQMWGGIGRDYLLPNMGTRAIVINFEVPIEGWRTDLIVTSEAVSAEKIPLTSDFQTPEQWFQYIMSESVENVAKAMDRRPDLIKMKAENGCTSIHFAALQQNPKIVDLLLDRGAKIDEKNDAGCNVIHYAAMGIPQMLDHVFKKGARPILTTESKRTPFSYAIEAGRHNMLYPLSQIGAPIKTQDANGSSVIHLAIWAGRYDMVEQLLKLDAPTNVFDVQGYGVVTALLRQPKREIIEAAIKHGADIDERDPMTGNTPMIWAAMTGGMPGAIWLAELGADIEAKNKEGKTFADIVNEIQHPVDRQNWQRVLEHIRSLRKTSRA